jgi:hypothetical protein
MTLRKTVWVLAGTLCCAWVTPLFAEPAAARKPAFKKPAPGKFIRLKRDAQGEPIALETATVRFVHASGEGDLVVDLVAAVHVGDRTYYDQLNRQFEDYDVVLYELVAPKGTRIPKGGRRGSDNPLALLHHLAKFVLSLESQTERIDYTRKNFVHADLSPADLAEAIRKRGDNGVTLFLSIAADLIRQQNLEAMKGPKKGDGDLDLFGLLLDPDASVKLKRLLAQQLETMGSGDGLGPTLNTLLVSDRNQAALKVLQKEMARGRKKIAIFYGAAHMPDFERRLREDFGLRRQSEHWRTAWDMRTEGSGINDLLKRLLP